MLPHRLHLEHEFVHWWIIKEPFCKVLPAGIHSFAFCFVHCKVKTTKPCWSALPSGSRVGEGSWHAIKFYVLCLICSCSGPESSGGDPLAVVYPVWTSIVDWFLNHSPKFSRRQVCPNRPWKMPFEAATCLLFFANLQNFMWLHVQQMLLSLTDLLKDILTCNFYYHMIHMIPYL